MTSAYGTSVVDKTTRGQRHAERIPYIPIRSDLQGSPVLVDFVRTEKDVKSVKCLFDEAIEDGQYWPFAEVLSDRDFRNYFFAHTALVVRNNRSEVIGTFYCKPNFPGRCSHICNGGFITDPSYRRRGVATLMATVFLRVARDLGFRAVLFNLVFETNQPSVRLWNKMGFRCLGTIPRAGHLKNGISDAHQYYFDLEKKRASRRNWLQNVFSWTGARLHFACFAGVAFCLGRLSRTKWQ